MKRSQQAELLGRKNCPPLNVVDHRLNRFVSASSNRFETVRARVFTMSVFLVVLLGAPTLFSYGIVGRISYGGHVIIATILLILPKKRVNIPLTIDLCSIYVLVECSFLLYFNSAALLGAFFWSPAIVAMFTIFFSPKKAMLTSVIYLFLILTFGLKLAYSHDFHFSDFISSENFTTVFLTIFCSQMFLAGIILTFERAKVRSKKEITVEHERHLESRRMAFVRELIGNVAHEINNPLAIIQASVLRLERAGLAKSSQEYIELINNIEEATNRVCSVRDNLGLFAVGDNREKLKATDVSSLFKRVIHQTKSKAIKSQLAFSDQSQSLRILCRPNQIGTALVALIVNAQEAIDKAELGRILVEAFLESQSLCFRVTDNGRGIPEDMRHKIFLPFFSTHSHQGSRGLGLSVSRGTIAEHGGCIEFENDPGNTRFIIRLPLNLSNQSINRPERRLS